MWNLSHCYKFQSPRVWTYIVLGRTWVDKDPRDFFLQILYIKAAVLLSSRTLQFFKQTSYFPEPEATKMGNLPKTGSGECAQIQMVNNFS